MISLALIPNFLELAWGECPWVISTLVPEPMDELDHKDITGQYDPEMLQSKTKKGQLGLRELYQPSFVFKLWLYFISIESRDVVPSEIRLVIARMWTWVCSARGFSSVVVVIVMVLILVRLQFVH